MDEAQFFAKTVTREKSTTRVVIFHFFHFSSSTSSTEVPHVLKGIFFCDEDYDYSVDRGSSPGVSDVEHH